jgi:hypothetical protein
MSKNPPNAPPRSNRAPGSGLFLPAAIAALLAAGGAILFLFNPAQSGFYPFCLFYKTTGLLCPGCGGLRATHQLLHGHLFEALHLNALFVLAIPLGVLWAFRIWNLKRRDPSAHVIIKPAWLWIACAVLIVFAIVRNLPFAPFTWLAGK